MTALEHAQRLIHVLPTDRGKTYEVWLEIAAVARVNLGTTAATRVNLGATYDRSAAEGSLRLHFVYLVASLLQAGAELHAKGELDV